MHFNLLEFHRKMPKKSIFFELLEINFIISFKKPIMKFISEVLKWINLTYYSLLSTTERNGTPEHWNVRYQRRLAAGHATIYLKRGISYKSMQDGI